MAKKQVALPDVEHSDIEILQFLLKVLYGHDCDALAMKLIARFGGFSGIFKATYEELISVPEVTERVASFFTFILPLNRQAILRSAPDLRIDGEAALIRFAIVFFISENKPLDVYLYLDKHGRVISADRAVTEDRKREIVSGVCRYGAAKLAWLRFFPYDRNRSAIDTLKRLELIGELAVPFSALKVELCDYVEYTPFEFYSLRRAVSGDDGTVSVTDADEAPYEKSSVVLGGVADYYKACVKRFIG